MTNPTADAAKLLPCPTCKSEKPEWRRAYVADGKVQTCRDPYHDTRAQPAPPAGELKLPDWPKRDGFCPVCNGNDYDVPCAYPTECPTGCWRAERLGLAARPKVEDGEVALAVHEINNKADCEPGLVARAVIRKWADLLERLAGEASIDRELAMVRQRALAEAVYRYEAAEAKLAEREAELAKTDAVIAWFDDYCGPSFKELAGEILIAKFEVAIARHAARQQQKASAEPTSSKAGETR